MLSWPHFCCRSLHSCPRSSLVLLYNAWIWKGISLGARECGGLVSRSLLRIWPRIASTLFFLTWSRSMVAQVDRDELNVAQLRRRTNSKALPKCISASAFGSSWRWNMKLNYSTNQTDNLCWCFFEPPLAATDLTSGLFLFFLRQSSLSSAGVRICVRPSGVTQFKVSPAFINFIRNKYICKKKQTFLLHSFAIRPLQI